MKKPIEKILPNPHRNFDIYPVGEAQVQLLMESISEVGMFLGLPARKKGNFYEIACGHHRIEALIKTGITHVDLAVNDYSDDEMLKIMIRENSTQRGNENFGAVLDSVGAVLVSCVRDVYGVSGNFSGKSMDHVDGNLKAGRGIGADNIMAKEPSLSEGSIKAALKTFRNTGVYLELLKKGGLPQEFWHLYDKQPITTIEAVAQFSKPAHAAAWVKGVDNDKFQKRIGIENHQKIISELINNSHDPISVKAVKNEIKKYTDANLGSVDPSGPTKEEKNLEEKAQEIVTGIKALKKKLEKFETEKGVQDCFIEDMDAVIDILKEKLDWFKSIRDEETINV